MLAPGTPAPDFSLPDHLGRTVRLTDLRGKRFVLWFFPKADTPGCTKQGCAFRDHSPAYTERKVEILGVSVDPPAANRAFVEKFGFPFRLLSDEKRAVAMAYGACETAQDQYARRITYVIGADGKIEQAIETKDPAGQAAALLGSTPA